jgi:hypothetical protein
VFARDQWICRICGDSFLYSDVVRRHIAEAHDEAMPPSQQNTGKVPSGSANTRRKNESKRADLVLRFAHYNLVRIHDTPARVPDD